MAHETTRGVQIPSGGPFRIVVPNLFGGVNTGRHAAFIEENELQDVRSYTSTQKGVLSNAYGQYTDDLNTNLTNVRTTHSGRYKTYAAEATAIYDALTTSAALLSGLTSNTAGGSFATMAGYDLFVNGTDMKKTTDGSTWTNLTAGATAAAPAGLKYIAAYNNRLFGCGHSSGIIRWSDVNDPTEWPTANSWDLNLSDNETYTGLGVWNESLFAFAETGAYVLQGFEFIRVTDFLTNASCTSHRSIISQPDFMSWWGRNGMMMMVRSDRGVTPPFEPWRHKYRIIRDRDRSNDANVWGSWYPHERTVYYNFAAEGAALAHVYFNVDTQGFFTSALGAGSSFTNTGGGTVRMSDGQLCHMANSGQIAGWLAGTLSEADDSTRYLLTKEFAPAGPNGSCCVNNVSVLGSGTAVGGGNFLTASLQLDGSGSDDISMAGTWDSGGGTDWVNFHFNTKCRSFAVKVADVGKGTNTFSSLSIQGEIVTV